MSLLGSCTLYPGLFNPRFKSNMLYLETPGLNILALLHMILVISILEICGIIRKKNCAPSLVRTPISLCPYSPGAPCKALGKASTPGQVASEARRAGASRSHL